MIRIGSAYDAWHLFLVSALANEQRIRELCAMAISAREAEWEPILSELRTRIHEHVLFLRVLTNRLADRTTESSSESKAAD